MEKNEGEGMKEKKRERDEKFDLDSQVGVQCSSITHYLK